MMARTFALAAILAAASLSPGAAAQVSTPDPARFVRWTVSDMRSFGSGALTPRALYVAAGMGGTLLLLSGLDAPLTERTVDWASGIGDRPRRIFTEVGNVNIVRPAALMFFLGTLASGDERLQDAAFTSVEAIVLSNLLTNTLKLVFGRARPERGVGATSFKPFSGRTSFPSGHATTVFALTTPWLFYYTDVPAIALFAVGVGTAFVRMSDNVHWFSDVLVGAAIGFGTGYLLSRRHLGLSSHVTLSPVARADGWGIGVRIML